MRVISTHRATFVAALLAVALLLATSAALPAPAGATAYDRRAIIVDICIAQLGKPYVWAAAGPNSFDCSGLVQYCYGGADIYVPHQSGLMWERCDPVSLDELLPGDLVFRTYSGGFPTSHEDVRHVGLYIGGGLVIHAPSAGKSVSYTEASKFYAYGRLKAKYWDRADRTYDPPLMTRGDFTGDGKDDLGMVVGMPNGMTKFVVYPSTGGSFAAGQVWWQSQVNGWDFHRTKAVAGDFDGNGKDDLALVYDNNSLQTVAYVFQSGGSSFTRVAKWWDSGEGGWDWDRTKVVAGDFSGDGKADLMLLSDIDGKGMKLHRLASTGTAFGAPAQMWGSGRLDARGIKLVAGDLDGDKRADLVALYDLSPNVTRAYTFISTGTGLRFAGPWWEAGGWSWERIAPALADVTGDGKADLVIMYNAGSGTSRLTVRPSTGKGFGAASEWYGSAPGGFDWELLRLGTGDFDGDGVDDVAATYDYGGSQVKTWAFMSNRTGFKSITPWLDTGPGVVDWSLVR